MIMAVITAIIIVTLLLLAEYSGVKFPKYSNEWGDTFAGVFSSLAFAWLVAGFFLQTKELRLQRKQLGVHSKALEQQAEELDLMNELETNHRVNELVEFAKKQVRDAGYGIQRNGIILIHAISSYDFVEGAFPTKRMEEEMARGVNIMTPSRKDYLGQIFSAYANWYQHERTTRIFLNTLRHAAILYFQNNEIEYDKNRDLISFFHLNYNKLQDVPFVADLADECFELTGFLRRNETEINQVRLAGILAQMELIKTDVYVPIAFPKPIDLFFELRGKNVLPEIAIGLGEQQVIDLTDRYYSKR